MSQIPPPVRRYLTGKLPSHSSTASLHENFHGMNKATLMMMLQHGGFVSDAGKPTKKALSDGLIDICQKNVIWNLDKVQRLLQEQGVSAKRVYVNQEVDIPFTGEPSWVNLGTIATYFGVSATEIGKWLDSEDLRGDDKLGSQEATDRGLVVVREMKAGQGKKTRKIAMWNLHLVVDLLKAQGRVLDFDYEATLKGKGKNSDVEVSSLDMRAKEFLDEFLVLYKDAKTRERGVALAKRQPTPFLKKAEEMLKKPGFFTEKKYMNYTLR